MDSNNKPEKSKQTDSLASQASYSKFFSGNNISERILDELSFESNEFNVIARRIFDHCRELTGAKSGYIALLDEKRQLNKMLFLEAGGLPCTVDPSLPMPMRGLRETAYATGNAVFENDFTRSKWHDYIPAGHAALNNVMFAPLRLEGKVIGVLGLANKAGDFNERDIRISESFGDLASEALENYLVKKAIEAGEKQYRSVLENAPDMIARFDRDRRILYANPAFCETAGVPCSDIEGKTPAETGVPPDVYTPFDNVLIQAIESGEQSTVVFKTSIRKSNRYFQTKIIPEINDRGSVETILTITRDITEIKKTEENLRENEGRLRQAQQLAGLGVWTWDISDDKTVWSDEMFEIYGISPESFTGRGEDYFQMTLPDDREKQWKNIETAFAKAIEESEKTEKGEYLIRSKPDPKGFRLRRPNGEIRDVMGDAVTIVNNDGTPIRMLGIIQDVTERIKTIEALHEREAAIRTIFKAAPVGIVTVVGGKINQANDRLCQMLGYNADELAGKSMDILYSDDAVEPDFRNEPRHETETGGMVSIEARMKRKDGSVIDVYLNSAPIDQAHPESGRIVTALDVTERKKLEERLMRAQRMEAIGQLAGGVAHDLNNMLMGIMGYAEILKLTGANMTDRVESANEIIGFSKRAADLTRQLLTFSRGAKGQNVNINIHTIVKEVVKLIEHTFEKKITIEKVFKAQHPVVSGDPSQVQNAILNLAVNARDAMPEGGAIVFATEDVVLETPHFDRPYFDVPPGNYLRVSVKDSGVGMDNETIKYIFEPFFTTKGVGKGTGLGLATVYGTAKSHGGAVTVESEPGHGATFSLYLPLDEYNASEVTTGVEATLKQGHGLVLIVEDEKPLRNMLEKMMQKLGYKTIAVEDGERGVAAYEELHATIDLVLLDFIMPNVDGLAAFDRMRTINPSVKAIMMSGYGLEARHAEIEEKGIKAVLKKPYTIRELAQKLHEVEDAK